MLRPRGYLTLHRHPSAFAKSAKAFLIVTCMLVIRVNPHNIKFATAYKWKSHLTCPVVGFARGSFVEKSDTLSCTRSVDWPMAPHTCVMTHIA